MNRIEQAILHFLHGYGFLQQYTSGFRIVEDAPYPYFFQPGKYEFLVYRDPVETVAPILSEISPTHSLCFFPKDEASLQAYKATGYRQRFTEHLMQIEIKDLPDISSDYVVQCATTPETLAAMSKAKGWGRKYKAEFLQHDNVYSYYIEYDQQVVAGANLLLLYDDNTAYIEDVFTVESYHRRGLGSALMAHLLQIAADNGIEYSTLVSFASAKAFYHSLGYKNLSDLKYLSIKA